MRPKPHAFRSLHVPGEIIDEDTVMGYVSKLCKHPLERPDLTLRLPHVEREKPLVEDVLDIFPSFPRLI